MSKVTNDGLTRSGTGCCIAVPIWQQWASKGWLKYEHIIIVYTRNSHVLFLASKLVTTVRFQKRKTTAVFFASVTLDCISLAVDSEHVSSGRECGDNEDMNTLSPSDKHTYTHPACRLTLSITTRCHGSRQRVWPTQT